MGNTAHIVYASSDSFAEILGVSLTSLYENSRDMEQIVVYIFDNNICGDNKKKLDLIAEKYSRHTIKWITAKNISQELGINVFLDRGSLSQYARLFVSSVLPQDLERVLYLDSDTIIRKSIKELWNYDIQGKTIGALRDAFSKYYRKNIDLMPEDTMFNSGVMIIDLKKWKETNVERRLLEFIRKKEGYIQQGDQGALNHVLAEDICCIDPVFNAVTIFFDFTYQEMMIYRRPPSFYSEEAVLSAVSDPTIVHFTTSFLSKRPWMKGCEHRYVEEWRRYKNLGPWKESELWDDNRPKWKRLFAALIKVVPRKVAIYLTGWLQTFLRPMIFKYRKNRIH